MISNLLCPFLWPKIWPNRHWGPCRD